MRRLILFILLVVCGIFGYAYSRSMGSLAAANTTTQTYKGTLTAIVFNGKQFHDIQNQTFSLQKKSASSGIIKGEISKIGKMPGTLHFSIPVTIKSDGTLSTTTGKDVGEMKLPMGMSKKMTNKSFKGNIKQNSLTFSLHVTSSALGIKMADASFTFQSTGV